MPTFQALNILTGQAENKPKYNETGVVAEVWSLVIPATIASGDTINGPYLPANTYLLDVIVDWPAQGVAGTFEAGITGTLGKWIATGNVTPRLGGVVHAAVAGTVGYTSTSDQRLLLTITETPTTPAGTLVMALLYTANP